MVTPNWKLPRGVSRGTWDYVQSPKIAQNYDGYFSEHPLMHLDLAFIRDWLPPIVPQSPPPLVADLGCGTGRVSRALSPLGYRLLNIDLSRHMLDELVRQTQHPELNRCEQANLVELNQCVEPNSLDLAVCLFSSIGMIRGHKHRVQFLQATRAALKPNARLILHAHNRYHSLWDPSGPRWLASTRWRSWFDRNWEYGDRVYAYRGLPAMFLHIYSRRELRRDLSRAGFQKPQFYPINTAGNALIPDRFTSGLRAGGYFVVARR